MVVAKSTLRRHQKGIGAEVRKIPRSVRIALLQKLDCAFYLQSIGFSVFKWQQAVLNDKGKRKVILAARQSGKSTIVAGKIVHIARFEPGSLCIIGAPTENQAAETMHKVLSFMRADPDYPATRKCSIEEVELENGSRIIVRTAKSDTFRGYSKPRVILLDEASRIEEEAYISGARPMLTDNPDGELIIISTPNGQQGFFYNAFFSTLGNWSKYLVRSPYQPVLGNDGMYTLDEYTKDPKFWRQQQAEQNVHAYFSPRHKDYGFQLEQLSEMGRRQYQQEYCCDFVEAAGQVFTYDEIAGMFRNWSEEEIHAKLPQIDAERLMDELRTVGGVAI
ncbi:MAG: hypothetical protein IAC42_02460 [Spirochaetes bacterium]|uniref:Uncharacterized protein n=1 Tax=Candidatus Aphodenecus pullistercoris TaxID=2840669 RepID=A0A9D9E9Z2_9SPIR|nr:hypothetical protein [Candidatus Aphodenecus pullistercoris]